MAYVYILQSVKNGRYYIGSTRDLKRRLKEHSQGKTKSLENILPVRLVFSQTFENYSMARKIEARLKKLKRRDYLEKIIHDGIIKMKIGDS